jgi:hypothetical protein
MEIWFPFIKIWGIKIILLISFRRTSPHDPSLGFETKARALKSAGRECNLGITFTLPRVQRNVREWAHTFPNGLPLWELESQWTPEYSKNNLKGQNSLDWKVPYTIGNLLRHRCLKWVHMIHLSIYNISYGQKKGQ